MPPTDCPSLDLLESYRSGLIDAALLESISDHIAKCPACETRLENSASRPNGLAPPRSRAPAEPAFAVAVARILEFPREAAPLGPGCRLRDYTLLETIGEGGMGTVYKARHERLDRIVAVKVIRSCLSGTTTALARFEREMKAVGRVKDDRIVQALDAGEADGVAYLAMEYVEGRNLSALVKEHGPLPKAQAFDIIRQAAGGLAHAHSVGLVHRDLKPGNLMLMPDGRVKILDLGLAAIGDDMPPSDKTGAETVAGLGELTQTGRAVGTLHYMAPEQKSNAHSADARADIYGLGATLWYLLTGTPPQPGPRPPQLSDAIWQKLLAENPNDRFRLAEEVAAALSGRSPRRFQTTAIAAGVLVTAAAIGLLMRDPAVEPGQSITSAVPPANHGPSPGHLGMNDSDARAFQQQWADQLQQPVLRGGPNGHRMALIGPGVVPLGPACDATITRPYELAATETTVGQFAAFVQATGYRTTAETNSEGGNYFDPNAPSGKKFKTGPQYTWRTPGYGAVESDQPVTQVSWADANAYCEWLTKSSGRVCRLPTEAEWLWAYRAGDAGDPSGAWARKPANASGNPYWIRSTVVPPLKPQPVSRRPANAWGLHDMIGNVFELCSDEYDEVPTQSVTDYCCRGTQHRFAVIHGHCYYSVVSDLQNSRGREATCREAVGFRVLIEIDSAQIGK